MRDVRHRILGHQSTRLLATHLKEKNRFSLLVLQDEARTTSFIG
jgi:hypothetical protein